MKMTWKNSKEFRGTTVAVLKKPKYDHDKEMNEIIK